MARTNHIRGQAFASPWLCPCGDAHTALWQNLCSSKFLGAVADGKTVTPGCFSALTRVGDAKAHGNFGVGEFERLSGELFAMDNEFYQLTADGQVHLADDTEWLNVAFLTHFQPARTLHVDKPMSFAVPGTEPEQDFAEWLDARLPSLDCFYAMAIIGEFKEVVVSAIPAQKPPYPAFAEARQSRVERTVKNEKGRMVAYFTPLYLGSIGVAGYHFHFLNDSRTVGGHVENFTVLSAHVELQRIENLHLGFPEFLNE